VKIDPSWERWLFAYVPETGGLALDVGANTGFWTQLLSERFHEVHAFEPQPGLLALQPRPSNVRLLEVAVSWASGITEFHCYDDTVHAQLASIAVEGERVPVSVTSVPTVSLDDLGYDRRDVDFIKIDVEGAEDLVIDGAFLTLLRKPGPQVLIEIHRRDCDERLRRTLVALSYNIQVIPHPDLVAGSEHHWILASR
jgi:FkbM family methyltransferase